MIVGLAVGAVLLLAAIGIVALFASNRGSGEPTAAFAVGDCVSGLPDAPRKAPCDSPNATYQVMRIEKTAATCGKEVGHFELSSARSYCLKVNLHVGNCYDDATKWVVPSPACAGYAFRVISILPGDQVDQCATIPGVNNWIRPRHEPVVTYCGWRKPRD
ncbi:LppU/SCO3897 family protein [Gordonia crocea]|uniref:Lipoprotein LppU n=1 Tax=Gordonia crocea TaxID=589162 RepID=A0A7I9UYM7_9ACTN|nr:hypothetical protein [Gordonia crocea]GED98032.1 hypothetical protein nbrc107697_20710 [Gordonia crocea]